MQKYEKKKYQQAKKKNFFVWYVFEQGYKKYIVI